MVRTEEITLGTKKGCIVSSSFENHSNRNDLFQPRSVAQGQRVVDLKDAPDIYSDIRDVIKAVTTSPNSSTNKFNKMQYRDDILSQRRLVDGYQLTTVESLKNAQPRQLREFIRMSYPSTIPGNNPPNTLLEVFLTTEGKNNIFSEVSSPPFTISLLVDIYSLGAHRIVGTIYRDSNQKVVHIIATKAEPPL